MYIVHMDKNAHFLLLAREGRGKGKRRFAPQGVWRSSGGSGQDVEPMVWLGEGLQRPPIPQPEKVAPEAKRRKDEYHLAEVCICTRVQCMVDFRRK